MKYLLDSNIYMDCYDRYYLLDYFPSFWKNFTPLINQHVVATDVMLDEHQNSAWFIKWFKANFTGQILQHTAYANEWAAVLNHVGTCGKYKPSALQGARGWATATIADPWLIAIAKKEQYTLVTSELGDININNKGHVAKVAKIPDIAKALGVPVIDRNSFFEAVKLSV